MTEEWTLAALKEHFEALLSERKAGDQEKDELRAEAIKAALASINLRLESMNEFRLALTKQQETLATKEAMEALRKSIEQQFSTLSLGVASMGGKSIGQDIIWKLIAAASGLVAIVSAIAFMVRG